VYSEKFIDFLQSSIFADEKSLMKEVKTILAKKRFKKALINDIYLMLKIDGYYSAVVEFIFKNLETNNGPNDKIRISSNFNNYDIERILVYLKKWPSNDKDDIKPNVYSFIEGNVNCLKFKESILNGNDYINQIIPAIFIYLAASANSIKDDPDSSKDLNLDKYISRVSISGNRRTLHKKANQTKANYQRLFGDIKIYKKPKRIIKKPNKCNVKMPKKFVFSSPDTLYFKKTNELDLLFDVAENIDKIDKYIGIVFYAELFTLALQTGEYDAWLNLYYLNAKTAIFSNFMPMKYSKKGVTTWTYDDDELLKENCLAFLEFYYQYINLSEQQIDQLIELKNKIQKLFLDDFAQRPPLTSLAHEKEFINFYLDDTYIEEALNAYNNIDLVTKINSITKYCNLVENLENKEMQDALNVLRSIYLKSYHDQLKGILNK